MQMQMAGARLAFVVVPQEGTVRRTIHLFDKKSRAIVEKEVEEPAGFLVYFPRGHVIRIKDQKQLAHYNLHLDAPICNMQGLSDPNSPLGKMLMAQDDATRRKAFQSMETMCVRLAEAKSGKIVLNRDPNAVEDETMTEAA